MLLILVILGLMCSFLGGVLIMVLMNKGKKTATTAMGSPPSSPAGTTGTAGGDGVPAIAGKFPARVFSPYWDTSDESVKWQSCPSKFITLAFVLGDSSGTPKWNGEQPLSSKVSLAKKIRAAGKDFIISFGGQAGTELGQAITDVTKLANAYKSVVDMYQAKWVDFDIEGSSTGDVPAVTRRHKAIAKLQKAKPDLIVSFTLPVMPSGLPSNEVNFLKIAKEQGVRVDVVNIMTMDYGPSFSGDMGAYATEAARNTYNQVQGVGLKSAKIGICPMIGVNDVQSEVFTVANARSVRDWARKTPWVRWLAFWSIGRDNSRANPNQLNQSSGIKQRDWEFSQEFAKF